MDNEDGCSTFVYLILLLTVGLIIGVAVRGIVDSPSCDMPHTIQANGETYCAQSYHYEENGTRLIMVNAIKLTNKIRLLPQLALEDPENVTIE